MYELEAASTELIADWIECSLLVASIDHIGKDTLNKFAAEELTANPNRVSLGIKAIARRKKVLGPTYPFSVNDFGVVKDPQIEWTNYAALVFLTPNSIARQTFWPDDVAYMSGLFEEISERALANFWGKGGQAVMFGHPSKYERPKEFDKAVTWLADRMGIQVGSGYRPPRRKDGGVDIVAWRRFGDERRGFPIALAQCTIQGEVYSKTSDIDVRLWSSWLAMDTDPLSCLMIPSTIPASGPEWGQLSTSVMVIERMRIMELLNRDSTRPYACEWATETRELLRKVLMAGEL